MKFASGLPGGIGRHDIFRWAVCGCIVLAAHVTALVLLRPNAVALDSDAGGPVVFVDLAPEAAAAPAPPSDLAPGPLQSDSEATDRAPPSPPAEQVETERQATPPDPPPPMKTPQDQGDEPSPAPPAEKAPTPPPPAPPEQQSDVAVPSAPPSVDDIDQNTRGPAVGRQKQAISPRTTRWQLSLVAHVERFKRYPKQDVGFGVVRLAFTIDRRGQLLGARIVTSSGSPVLDAEALATLQRASPFPRPPVDVTDNELSFVLPIRYAPPSHR